jgi:hypothetical protein
MNRTASELKFEGERLMGQPRTRRSSQIPEYVKNIRTVEKLKK